ncbi:MAG: DEAD/DEAH box helicase, partial [Terriglobus roseus]|nr:DEAD/DEAH box helicase [Terriglobus roseus]
MAKRLLEDAPDTAIDEEAKAPKRVKTEAEKQAKRERKEAKAARRAEKEARKALKEKKKKKKKASSSTDTADGAQPTPIDTSTAPSKNACSATSPEPANESKAVTAYSTEYSQDAALSALPQSKVDEYLSSNHIAVSDPRPGSSDFRPITDFSYLPVEDTLKQHFTSFSAPTPIQAAAWPWLFSGRDVIGVAETGSGKTLAFGLPCVRHLLAQKRRKGPGAVIVSPTRELALQIKDQLKQLTKSLKLRVDCIYGGVPKDEQRHALKTGNIIVATPGRLNDLLTERADALAKAKYLVLDEADR